MPDTTDPPVMSRPAPLWSWNDKLEPDELRRQIHEMVAQGWGGFFMHPRVGYTTHYLSDRWMEIVRACIDEAKKLGVYAWIYDEDRWPSGYGGGGIAELDLAYRCRALVIRPKGTQRTAPPGVTDPPAPEQVGKLGTVYGYDYVLGEVTVGGAPHVICEQVAALGTEWYNGSTYIDLMNADAVRAFLDKVLGAYRRACGDEFGKTVPGAFTDEPLYLNNALIDAFGVPWSTKLPDYFRALKGYDIRQHLPRLFVDEGDYRRVRFDFYDAAARLFRESFTKQYHDWCAKNNLIFTGHFQAEDTLRLQAQWTGDVMAHYPHMHWPGIDKLERNVDQVALVKQLTSVTDQLGKPRAFCEAFGISGAQVSFFHRKWIGDWLIALGINFINPHLTHYSFRGPRKRDCPPNLGPQAPWWPDERGYSDYLARLCDLLSSGQRRVDVLMLQPLTSVWCDYSPMQWDSGYAPVARYDAPYQDLAAKLLAAGIDFHLGNETIMAEHAAVEGERLRVGRQSYHLVVLPPTLNLRRSTLALLQKFLAAGGKVVVTGATPTHVDGVETDVSLPGAVFATRVATAVPLLAKMLPDRVRAIDVRAGQVADEVLLHSRDHESGAVHFLANTSETRDVDLRIELPAHEPRPVAIFDPLSGRAYRAAEPIELTLSPAGSVVLLTGDQARHADGDGPKLLGGGAIVGKPDAGVTLDHTGRFEVQLLDDNVLRVDVVELEIAGERFVGPVYAAWPVFLSAPDGTPFVATYRFDSTCEFPGAGAAVAVIDSAEHLETITFNGQQVQPRRRAGEPLLLDHEKSWVDLALTRVPLPGIRRGPNVLKIVGRKFNVAKPGGVSHRPTRPGPEPRETQLEDLYVLGRFAVQEVGPGCYRLAPPGPFVGGDLTRQGAPFYHGRVMFRCELSVPGAIAGEVWLRLHGLEAAAARVRVSGQDCGAIRWQPHVVGVTSALRSGINRVEIELATTPFNLMGPTHARAALSDRVVRAADFQQPALLKRGHELASLGLHAATLETHTRS